MKSTTLYIIVCLMTLVGCNKQTEPLILNHNKITLNVGQEAHLNVSPAGDYRWSSSNDFAIEVSPAGLVRAKFAGTGRVVVSTADGRSAWCTVSVLPTLHDFAEPLLLLGAHPREVTAIEKRTTTLESPTLLIYADENPMVERLYYLFGSSGLTAAAMELRRDSIERNALDLFMAERYQYIGQVDDQASYQGHEILVNIEKSAHLWTIRYFDNRTLGK